MFTIETSVLKAAISNTYIHTYTVFSEVSTEAARPAEGYSVTSIGGLKSLGVRELGYKLAFLANSVAPASENKVRGLKQKN